MRLESNSATAEELAAVLKANGFETETTKGSEEVTVTSVPDQASPGESPSGTEPGEPVPTPEAGKPKKQATEQAYPPVEPGEPKPELKFEPRRKQLERQITRLHEDLDLERGSKATLQAKLSDLEAKLAGLQPAEPEPKKAEELVKPKRPTRAECEFDDDKYETAMDKYETDMSAYNAKVVEKTVNERLEANSKAQAERAAKAEADAIFDTFVTKRNEQAKEIPGYQELLDEVGDYDLPKFVELQIIQSEVPTHLIHFFNQDQRDNDGKELARLARLDPLIQVRELTRIETRIAMEREAGKKKPAAAAPVATAPVVDEEVKPKPVPVPAKPKIKPEEAPIEPLGGRSSGRTPVLADAKTAKEYIALRNQGISQAG